MRNLAIDGVFGVLARATSGHIAMAGVIRPVAVPGAAATPVRPTSDASTILEQSLNSEVEDGRKGSNRSLTENPQG